jgi:hypothetical protein
MQFTRYLSAALLAASTLASLPAAAANICQADKLTCPTTMPVGGYCECKSHGAVQSGTVAPPHAPHAPVNAAAGGCNLHPNAPGCP